MAQQRRRGARLPACCAFFYPTTPAPLLSSPSFLLHHCAARFYEREGERLYRGLYEGFRGVQYGAPPPAPPGAPAAPVLSPSSHSLLLLGRAGGSQLQQPPTNQPPAPLSAAGAPLGQVLAGVQQLLDIYTDRGYALKATLTPGASGGGAAEFTVRSEGSANLWSLQALASRRSAVYNVHDAATVAAYLRACGLSSTCRLSWTDTSVVQAWSVA